jgi:hypothetical protein
MSQLGLYGGNVRDALGPWDAASPSSPSTFYRANMPRFGLYDSASDTGQVALATGVMTAVRIKLGAGDVVTNISVRSGATAAGTPTNYWVALYSSGSTPALLSQSADQTSTAWAANTTKTLALATAQTISDSGLLLGRDHGDGDHPADPAGLRRGRPDRHRRGEPVGVVRLVPGCHRDGHPGIADGQAVRSVRRPHLINAARGR